MDGVHGHRKRVRRWDVAWTAHYLTFSCYRRQPFFRGRRSPGWFLDALRSARLRTPFDLWAWVIMPEHVHVLILPHEGVTISTILYQMKKPVTTWALACARREAPEFLDRMLDRQSNGLSTIYVDVWADEKEWLGGILSCETGASGLEVFNGTAKNPRRGVLIEPPTEEELDYLKRLLRYWYDIEVP